MIFQPGGKLGRTFGPQDDEGKQTHQDRDISWSLISKVLVTLIAAAEVIVQPNHPHAHKKKIKKMHKYTNVSSVAEWKLSEPSLLNKTMCKLLLSLKVTIELVGKSGGRLTALHDFLALALSTVSAHEELGVQESLDHRQVFL